MTGPLLTAAKQFVQSFKDQCRRGERPDAAGMLARHPELRNDKSAAIDVAYEEFCTRRKNGERIDVEEFCARFPDLHSTLFNLLLLDGGVADYPSKLDKMEAAARPWPKAGERLGDFTLIRELGRGGFARVYLATEASAGGRPVAVKLSRKKSPEASTLGRLDHDHIVPILWADRDDATGFHVVCMPYFGSTTLRDVVLHAYPREDSSPPARGTVITEAIRKSVRANDPPPARTLSGPNLAQLSYVDAVLRLAEDLAGALAFLRERKLVHGDLKPANVLLTPSGRPLLLDFNLSMANNGPFAIVGGTFHYMAPEQITAWMHSKPIATEEGGQADLYSLGLILYKLLTGRHPLGTELDTATGALLIDHHSWDTAGDSETGAVLARQILQQQKQPIQPIRELNPAVPARVARLLHRCLAVDPKARPAGAAAVAAELRRHRRRWSLRPAAATVCALLLAAVAVLAPRVPVKTAPVRDTAIDAHVRKTGTLQGDWEDHAGRGRAKMLLGQDAEAVTLFLEADRIVRNLPPEQKPAEMRLAPLWACLSYCCCRQREHMRAEVFGEKAMATGFRCAAVLNNVGYSHLQKRKYDKAAKCLTEALRRDPSCLPAMRNEVQLGLARCRDKLIKGEEVTVPGWLLHQLDHVIPQRIDRGCGEPAILYKKAASLCMGLGDVKRACTYLSQACRLGANLTELKRDPVFNNDKVIVECSSVAKPANLQRPVAASLLDACLVDPLASTLP